VFAQITDTTLGMALSENSTLADAKAQYLGNLSYSSTNSAAKCRLFIEAAEALLMLMPTKTARGRNGMQVEMNVDNIRLRLEKAERWLATSGSAGGAVVHANFNDFRS
jgi:hypothetical protein